MVGVGAKNTEICPRRGRKAGPRTPRWAASYLCRCKSFISGHHLHCAMGFIIIITIISSLHCAPSPSSERHIAFWEHLFCHCHYNAVQLSPLHSGSSSPSSPASSPSSSPSSSSSPSPSPSLLKIQSFKPNFSNKRSSILHCFEGKI